MSAHLYVEDLQLSLTKPLKKIKKKNTLRYDRRLVVIELSVMLPQFSSCLSYNTKQS